MPRLYALILKPSERIPFVPPPDGQVWNLRHAALVFGRCFDDYAAISFKTSDGPEVCLGTLRRGNGDTMEMDLPISEYVEFISTGNTEVHLTGYLTDDDEIIDEDEGLGNVHGLNKVLMNGGDGRMGMMMALDDSEDSDDPDALDALPPIEESVPKASTDKRKAPASSPGGSTPDQPLERRGKRESSSESEPKQDKPLSRSAAKRQRKKQKREAEAKAQSETPAQPEIDADIDIQPPETPKETPAAPKPVERKKKRFRRFSNGFVIENVSYGPDEGPIVKEGDKVSIKYLGKLSDGTIFDDSRNTIFTYKYGAATVVKGLDKGLDDMRPGDKRKLTVPPKMGYGSKGAGDVIPPDATLYFDIELVEINA